MSSLTIETLDDELTDRLRARAVRHSRSIQDEAASILREALSHERARTGADLADSIRAKFAPLGDFKLDLPSRVSTREPPRFDE